MPQDRRTATYKILKANNPLAENLLKAKENAEGYHCQIFFPIGSDSVYGVLDKYHYKKDPDLDKLFICTSAMQESWQGSSDGLQYDPFLDEPPQIITTFDKKLPPMSKVILYYNSGIRMFRVAYHRSYDGDGPLFIRNVLQPLS